MLRTMRCALWALLLAAVAASPAALAAKGQTKLHWYGQSAWKIETPSGGVILIDPWLTVLTNPDKSSIAEPGRVDYILISHGHFDHVGNAVEIGKKTGAVLITTADLGRNMVAVAGYPKDKVVTACSGGTVAMPKAGARVTLVNAAHGSDLLIPKPPESGPVTVPGGNPVGFVLQIDGGPTIYHTVDTDVAEDMKLIPMFNRIDVMLACIGGNFTMDPVRAALAVQWAKPTHVIPMHYGTFPVLAGTPEELRAALAKRGLAGKLIVMKPGEDRTF